MSVRNCLQVLMKLAAHGTKIEGRRTDSENSNELAYE